ncbi:MAG: hypothetical protein ACRD0N_05130 [Acidimicrobiales bacterium]
MATLTSTGSMGRPTVATPAKDLSHPGVQAFWLLRLGFTVAPILFGLDKFAHVLVDWDRYLAPEFTDLFNAEAHTLMYLVGAVEILAGLVVLLKPRFGGYLVAAWLGAIIVNLLLQADFYDIALRDFGLLLGALTLARLASAYQPAPETARPRPR